MSVPCQSLANINWWLASKDARARVEYPGNLAARRVRRNMFELMALHWRCVSIPDPQSRCSFNMEYIDRVIGILCITGEFGSLLRVLSCRKDTSVSESSMIGVDKRCACKNGMSWVYNWT